MLTLQTVPASDYPFDEYPVNVLRNRAIQAVQTTHVVYVDVDFWESSTLWSVLHSDPIRLHLASQGYRSALVIPAFQLYRQCQEWRDCVEVNLPQMPHSIEDLEDRIVERRASVFDPTNFGGHGSTLYMEWMDQERGSLLELPCVLSNRYEPYLVFSHCRQVPPFQDAFKGYGKNKMSWMLHLRRRGWKFWQLGGTYVVHYPHLDSASRIAWNERPEAFAPGQRVRKREYANYNWLALKRGQTDATFVKFRQWLQDTIPDETILKKCPDAADDDAKLWIQRTVRTGEEEDFIGGFEEDEEQGEGAGATNQPADEQ